MSALGPDAVKSRAYVTVTIGGTDVANLRAVSGGGVIIPQIDATSTGSLQQEFSSGRCSYTPLRVTFINGKDNTKLITDAIKYMNDPQNGTRQDITLTELTKDSKTAGYSVNYKECFCIKLRLPTGTAQEGTLTTDMEWAIHYAEIPSAGGISPS